MMPPTTMGTVRGSIPSARSRSRTSGISRPWAPRPPLRPGSGKGPPSPPPGTGRDTGRGPIVSEDLPQRPRPFPGGSAGSGGVDRYREQIIARLGRSPEGIESVHHRAFIAALPPGHQSAGLLRLRLGVHLVIGGETLSQTLHQRRSLGLGVPVDAHDHALPRFDGPEAVGMLADQTLLHVPEGLDRTAQVQDAD